MGPSISFQRWQDFSPNPLLAYNASFALESYSESSKSSLYAQFGYLVRGSSLRAFTWQGQPIGTQGFRFNNLGLEIGAKRKIKEFDRIIPYYMIGLRLEYTISTNLEQYERFNSPYYPNDAFVENWVYGATVGGGFEWTSLSELFRPYFEITFNPDAANQYFQPPIPNVIDPFGNTVNLRERVIRNLALEFKVGFKFLRKVEYID